MKILPVLGAFAILIAGQDTKAVAFPPGGNGSSLEIEGKPVSVLQPDMTQGTVLAALVPPQPQPQPQPMLPSDYFFPGKDFSILVTLRRRSFDHPYPLCAIIIQRRASIVTLTSQCPEINSILLSFPRKISQCRSGPSYITGARSYPTGTSTPTSDIRWRTRWTRRHTPWFPRNSS